jgi:hypothetical protein
MKVKSEVVGGAVTGIYLLCVAILVYWKRATLPVLELNAIGDFLAGVFGPIAFLWLVLGYLQQGRELKLSSDALQLQAQELKNSVDQQKELVAVSREQVEAELQNMRSAREQRARTIRPLFVATRNGGSHSGNRHELEFSIQNLGFSVTNVNFGFFGSLAKLSQNKHLVENKEIVRFKIEFDGSDGEIGDALKISYLDADLSTGVCMFDIAVVVGKGYPELKLEEMV